MIFLVSALMMCLVSIGPATAGNDLCSKVSTSIAVEIDGLGAPDAQFAIAKETLGEKSLIEQIQSKSSVGDQGKSEQFAQSRSSGCSIGCSTGCSVGCSSGCSVGCSNGCRRY